MDEGFATFAEGQVSAYYYDSLIMHSPYLSDKSKLTSRAYALNQETQLPLHQSGSYDGYFALAKSGFEEPMTTHADHYQSNYAYSLDAYVKGAVFLSQLEYVIGTENVAKGLLRYFNTWKFKHPNPNDITRVMEKQSGLELDWYKEDWVNTLNTIDYSVKAVEAEGRKTTKVTIERLGKMAMPLDVLITYSDGDQELFYAPLESMRGEKPASGKIKRTVLPDHRWVDAEYSFEIPEKTRKIAKIEIDPAELMADIARENNVWEKK